MANVWREPIFDRTWADVEFAMQKIAEWIEYNISAAEYDEKVRIENEKLVLNEGYISLGKDKLSLNGDGRAIVENDALVVRIGVVYDLKGCLNLFDINRIEENIAYLSERFTELSYPNSVRQKQWGKDGLPNTLDTQRIVDNIRSLISAFYSLPDAPPLPNSISNYDDINLIERNIDLIKYLLDCMVNSFKKAGALKCGSSVHLPIRR